MKSNITNSTLKEKDSEIGSNSIEFIDASLPAQETTPFFSEKLYERSSLRSDMHSLDQPIFALKTGLHHAQFTVNGKKTTVIGNPKFGGIATMEDRKIWLFAASKFGQALNAGRPIFQPLRFQAAEYLKWAGKDIGGQQYADLEKSLNRLMGTILKTEIKAGGKEVEGPEPLITRGRMSRRKGVKKGEAKDTYIELTFPEFFMRQIKAKEIKVLHPPTSSN